MSPESQGEMPIEHEGERYLRMLGLEGFADEPIGTTSGQTIAARDFLDVCGEHARPMLKAFEAMDPSDPRYELTKSALQKVIGNYLRTEK